jgi:hypothetical protein
MNTSLTVTDPLAGQEVMIIITLPPSEQPRNERQALISVGVAEQLPVIKTGKFGDIPAFIHLCFTHKFFWRIEDKPHRKSILKTLPTPPNNGDARIAISFAIQKST